MSPNEEVFVCSCQEHLKTTEDVEGHLRGDKNWSNDGHGRQCRFPGCKTISPQTSNAKRHWKTHLPKRLRNYFCPKCDESYAKREQLEKHMAAPVCLKNRKRCRSVFEEDSALEITFITPRNDMSSPDGHAAELETTSEVPPSTGTTSPPSATSTPSLTEEAAEMQKAWLSKNGVFFPTAVLRELWTSLPPGPPPDDYSDLSDNELGTQPSSDEWKTMTPFLESIRERSTGLSTTASLGNRGLHHTQHPNDTRANTGTYICMYDGCTLRFESQPALQAHKWYFHPSQEHNNNHSGAESGAASVSPRPHARPVLRSEHTNVPHVQPPKHRFTIGRSQESQLGDLRTRYARRELPKFHVLVAGRWCPVGSLLSDLPENVRFEFHRPGPSSMNLWLAIEKATPPEEVRAMFDTNIYYYHVDGRLSQWAVDLEWTEEGITGRWQEFGTALKWPEETARRMWLPRYRG